MAWSPLAAPTGGGNGNPITTTCHGDADGFPHDKNVRLTVFVGFLPRWMTVPTRLQQQNTHPIHQAAGAVLTANPRQLIPGKPGKELIHTGDTVR